MHTLEFLNTIFIHLQFFVVISSLTIWIFNKKFEAIEKEHWRVEHSFLQ